MKRIIAVVLCVLLMGVCVFTASGCASEATSLNASITINHCTIKTNMDWEVTSDVDGRYAFYELPDNVMAVTYTVGGRAGSVSDNAELRDLSVSALHQLSHGSIENASIDVISVYVKEKQGYATASIACELRGESRKGFICSNVGWGGTAVCAVLATEDVYVADEDMIRAVAQSIRYSGI